MTTKSRIVPRATMLLPLFWVLLALPATAGPVPLTVDRARSSVVAIADVAGFLGFLGHPHAVLATEVSVDLVYDEETPRRRKCPARWVFRNSGEGPSRRTATSARP